MSNPRKAVPSLSFNGKNVTTKLKEFLESVSYTDVASGDSDSIDISLHNIGMKWMGAWYPKKETRSVETSCFRTGTQKESI